MSRRRRNETEEQRARRELISDFLSAVNIQSTDDIQELFKEALAGFMEGSLESELDDELGYEPYDVKNKETDNSRNGHSKKTLRTSMGKVDIEVPRDRNGEFEPKILPKNQTSISQDMENKIISMYAKGMSTSDIEDHIRDIYGLEIFDTTVSRITDILTYCLKVSWFIPYFRAICLQPPFPFKTSCTAAIRSASVNFLRDIKYPLRVFTLFVFSCVYSKGLYHLVAFQAVINMLHYSFQISYYRHHAR